MRPDMAQRYSVALARDVVRIAQLRGLTGRQVAADFGIELSTRGKWVRAMFEKAKVPAQDGGLLRDTERLRKGNRIRMQQRQAPKRAATVFAPQKP